jgi:hypothetical protein
VLFRYNEGEREAISVDRVWLKLIGVMVFASIIKYAVMSPLFWVTVDLAALAVCYFLLRAIPYINLRTSMLYLSGFTGISILVDLRIIGGLIGNILSLLVIGWLLWRNNLPRIKKQPLRHKWHK